MVYKELKTTTEIIRDQEAKLLLVNQGALHDKPDHRDHKAEEIMAGLIIKRPSWEEGYSAIKELWPDMPDKIQNSKGETFSCTGQATSQYKQILQAADTGEKTELSAFSIFNPIAYPGAGAYVRDAVMRPVTYGVNKESTLASNLTSEEMVRKFDFEPYKKEAEFYKNVSAASVTTQDFDKLADMIFLNKGFVSGWGNHCTYFSEYGILNGVRYLLTPNSYGHSPLYYFEKKMDSPLFSAWTSIDMKANSIDLDALFSDLHYGDKGEQVERLLKALARHHWYLGRAQRLVLVNIYDDRVADLVMRFKMATFLSHSVWDRMWEKYVRKGHTVDVVMRQFVNDFPIW